MNPRLIQQMLGAGLIVGAAALLFDEFRKRRKKVTPAPAREPAPEPAPAPAPVIADMPLEERPAVADPAQPA